MTMNKKVSNLFDIKKWYSDGTSSKLIFPTSESSNKDSELTMRPVAYFRDPFRGGENLIVMCEAFTWKDASFSKRVPALTNFRHFSDKVFSDEITILEEP